MEINFIKHEKFNNVCCDFYLYDNDIWMTREQIGLALDYTDPRKAIQKIHNRHKDRLDKFKGVVNLVTPGGEQEVCIYSPKGIYEICRWSQQPKANDFFDWVYDVLEAIRLKKIVPIDSSIDTALNQRANFLKLQDDQQQNHRNEIALSKLEIVKKAIEIQNLKKHHINIVPLIGELARDNNTSSRSIYRLVYNYKKDPLSIYPKSRINKGTHNSIDKELLKTALHLYNDLHVLEKSKIYNILIETSKEKNLKMCSRATLYRILE